MGSIAERYLVKFVGKAAVCRQPHLMAFRNRGRARYALRDSKSNIEKVKHFGKLRRGIDSPPFYEIFC